ncbi:probable ubiquitin receptor RAD23 isoform X2 [Durio zibethinus]|uniref:Probable ubiquitin receptor RAD23 isoform X2 n=1 Tax=Durio zibethinus TaxID=66656 RepID=A0A6P5WYL1_DURZI|nr:probable ubiquitin receptor RAD23 isoform X2 [Durio zibethinus]
MDVIFETQRGRPFSIEVGFFDTVLEIKEKVQKYQGIPIPSQTLVFNGKVLQDEKDVEFCEILQNSRIQLLLAPEPDKAQVNIEQSSPSKKIQLNLTDNTEIDVNIRSSPTGSGTGSAGAASTGSKRLKLMVLPKCETKKIPVEVNASDNVRELRKELQKLHQRLHFHLPQEGYFFIYKQNVMDEDRSFRWHQVAQGDTIEIFNGSVTGGS